VLHFLGIQLKTAINIQIKLILDLLKLIVIGNIGVGYPYFTSLTLFLLNKKKKRKEKEKKFDFLTDSYYNMVCSSTNVRFSESSNFLECNKENVTKKKYNNKNCIIFI
jgi:hypothetical protein